MFNKRNRLFAGGLFVAVTACVAPLIAQQDRGAGQQNQDAQPAQAREAASQNPNDITLDQARKELPSDDLRLALLLNAVSPAIGGVLVRGEKGTAKSTIVRALATLLPDVDVVAGCAYSCAPGNPDAGPQGAGSFVSGLTAFLLVQGAFAAGAWWTLFR